MKNSDQLQFTYHDVTPPRASKQRSAEPPAPGKRIPIAGSNEGTKPENTSSKEARLVFYSHLAAQNGPTIRIQRPNRNMIVRPQIGESDELTDNFMKNIDFELSEESPDNLIVKTASRFTSIPAPRFKKHLNLHNIFSKLKLTLNKTRNKRTYLLIALLVIFAAAVIFGVSQSVNNSRQKALQAQQAQAEWEQSKKQWECAVARYEAKQNNTSLESNKEKSCVNIN